MRFPGHHVLRSRAGVGGARCPRVSGLGAVLAVATRLWAGEDFSSLNLDKLERFRAHLLHSNGPTTVLAFGDSLSIPWRSFQKFLFIWLARAHGYSGTAANAGIWGETLLEAGGGAFVQTYPTYEWFAPHLVLRGAGWGRWYAVSEPRQSLLADRVGLFWTAMPEGGPFSVSLATNGGPWGSPIAVCDGYAPAPEGRYTNWVVARDRYQLRVDNLAGSNYIVMPELFLSDRKVKVSFISRDGMTLDAPFFLPTNVVHPIFAAVRPHLVVWHMKELADIGEIGLSNRLEDFERLLALTAPQADVLYVGTPYEARDLNSAYTETQNRIVRTAAARHARAYFDGMTPCVSYSVMTNRGFLDDAVHPSNACYEFLAGLAIEELQWKKDVPINLVSMRPRVPGGGWELSARGVPGLSYILQRAGGLDAPPSWTDLGTLVADTNGGGMFFLDMNALSRAAFYRLRATSPP